MNTALRQGKALAGRTVWHERPQISAGAVRGHGRCQSSSLQALTSASHPFSPCAPQQASLRSLCGQHHTLRSSCQKRRGIVCQASSGTPDEQEQNQLFYSLLMASLWVGLVVYAFVFSPNQTPYRDQIFIKLLVGLREPGEDFMVNQVYTGIFNLLGLVPLMYACLLIPGARSANKVPAWPFVAGSFAFGMFSLFPYFALWRPDRSQQLPPPASELEGWNKLVMKGAETPVLPAIIILGVLSQFYVIATAGGEAWTGFGKLIEESRLVHISTLDLLCLSAFAPFWMSNDAEGREWEGRETILPVLQAIPILGPAIYLFLRPKTDLSKE